MAPGGAAAIVEKELLRIAVRWQPLRISTTFYPMCTRPFTKAVYGRTDQILWPNLEGKVCIEHLFLFQHGGTSDQGER